MHIYIYIDICKYVYVYIYTRVHIHKNYIDIDIHIHIHIWVYSCIAIRRDDAQTGTISMSNLFVYACIHLIVHMYINAHTYNKIQHNTIQHNTTQYNTTQYNTTQHNTIQHNTAQYNTTQHNATQHNTIQYNTILMAIWSLMWNSLRGMGLPNSKGEFVMNQSSSVLPTHLVGSPVPSTTPPWAAPLEWIWLSTGLSLWSPFANHGTCSSLCAMSVSRKAWDWLFWQLGGA